MDRHCRLCESGPPALTCLCVARKRLPQPSSLGFFSAILSAVRGGASASCTDSELSDVADLEIRKMKRFLFLVLIAVAVSVVINVVLFLLQSPEEKDQQVILDCWEESKKGSLTPVQKHNFVGACQALELVYRLNYGVSAFPGKNDV